MISQLQTGFHLLESLEFTAFVKQLESVDAEASMNICIMHLEQEKYHTYQMIVTPFDRRSSLESV